MMYDAVVLGLGGMGSAALAHLAKRGRHVLGIDQFAPAHDLGSSTGQSRIIRMAYYEDPAYVPLLRRAYELWTELERDSRARLLDLCGILMVGGPDSRVLRGAAESAHRHAVAIEALERSEIARRFPQLRVRDDECGLFEPNAGMVFPEAAIDAHLRVAEQAGAEIRSHTRAASYRAHATGISVELADGSAVAAQRLAVCAGPWLPELARELALPLRVQRNVQIWFEPATRAYGIDRFPAFFLDRADAPAALYGFPDYGAGVKAALHGFGASTSAECLDRTVHPADVRAVAAALDDFLPGAAGTFRAGKVCMYTLTPDEHFVIDTDPRDPRVVIAGGFSGHGFKFCSVVGEIVADLIVDGSTRHPIEFLGLGRLIGPDPSLLSS